MLTRPMSHVRVVCASLTSLHSHGACSMWQAGVSPPTSKGGDTDGGGDALTVGLASVEGS